MIISDEQARLAAEYLKSSGSPAAQHASHEVEPELMDRVRDVLSAVPETRDDRVLEARERLTGGAPDSHDVAAKLINRVMSDALR